MLSTLTGGHYLIIFIDENTTASNDASGAPHPKA